ncbi:MAG TPA: putative maltokinase, partial [Actinomycetota bacterium]
FDLGVDGLRLDAVPYLIEREGTSCENLPETHDVLRDLRAHVDGRYDDRMLLAEANQWPEDAVPYFGDGDECHMAFHFPLMPRMFMSTRMEDRYPIIDILSQTPEIPDGCQWALFLRNHDELTLEMVTDEERDYMYRVYAEDPEARINLGIRRRLAPLLGNNRRVIEMMNGLLFSLPGTPVIYYGDEIGMGDNIFLGDRNGVRTPMQWSADRNAGFSRANPQRLYLPVIIDPEYHSEAVNVESQQNNPHSLLWWMKRMMALRNRHHAFGRGAITMLYPGNRKVLAFLREHEDERILVVANLSRHAQYVELDLSAFEGATPVELFGATDFPSIGELPYLLTLGPHAFYWFALEPQAEAADPSPRRLPVLEVAGSWHGVFAKKNRRLLEEALPGYLRGRRWFGGKARRVKATELLEAIPVSEQEGRGKRGRVLGYVTLIRTEYTEGDPETYVLPLTCATPERTDELRGSWPPTSVARVRIQGGEQLLHEALDDASFSSALLEAVARRRHLPGSAGKLVATRTAAFREARGPLDGSLEPRVMDVEQSNTSIAFGDRFMLKLFRRPDEGVNPELEIGRFLTDEGRFPHIPRVAGALEYRQGRRPTVTLGILQELVANQGDAWSYTLDALGGYLDEVMARRWEAGELPPGAPPRLLELARTEAPHLAHETIGAFLESARLLGERTAELHHAMASSDDPSFVPEAFSRFHQRSLYQRMRTEATRTLQLVRERSGEIPGAPDILELEPAIMERIRVLLDGRLSGSRIRIHGDFHLGQVLSTGKDFVLIDFEGEPARPVGERRIKRSPLRDVAGMLRSFHYASYSAMLGQAGGVRRAEGPGELEPWLRFWYRWVGATYLRAYLDHMANAALLPETPEETAVLLDLFMLDKALYELAYEANNRPEWVTVPVRGILDLMEGSV